MPPLLLNGLNETTGRISLDPQNELSFFLNPKNAFGFYFSGANARFEPKTRKSWLDKTEHTVLSM